MYVCIRVCQTVCSQKVRVLMEEKESTMEKPISK